jgi:uncharacterized protein YuzE
MRIGYYPDTDTLYIELSDRHGTNTRACAKDMAVDLDANNEPIGIEIENASKKVDLSRLKTQGLAHMRIAYDPVSPIRNLLLDADRSMLGPLPDTMNVHVEMGGNGDSARIVSDVLSRQTEFEPGQELLR